MKFSLSWLKKFVNIEQTPEQLAEILTMSGLEVEAMEVVAPPFNNVVLAKVVAIEKHPQADRLNVCQVDVGEKDLRQIVCGAPNVTPNIFVPCAMPGAILPNGLTIKISKLRSIESQGMLCSAEELGLTNEQNGLYILNNLLDEADLIPGKDIRQLLDLDDICFTLKITPNRGDCLSLLGIAREIAALTQSTYQLPQFRKISAEKQQTTVEIENFTDCSKYLGQVINDVNAKSQTPAWMVNCLQRSGIRSISALVDITNYVMLELGQPLHAFDYDNIDGNIKVRRATNNEKLLLINDKEINLDSQVLVIADQENVLAMAGIMGGISSAISLNSRNILLESAFFHPLAVAGQARRFNFTSDASARFERGVDPDNCDFALQRAMQLVLEICGGKIGVLQTNKENTIKKSKQLINLRFSRVKQNLGINLSEQEMLNILQNLGFVSSDIKQSQASFSPPSWRFDINIEEDLIEEIARVYGYNNIPIVPPQAKLNFKEISDKSRRVSAVRRQLAELGFCEVVNYAFIESELAKTFTTNADDEIKIANPIASNLVVMRSQLLSGLIENLQYNLNRQQSDVRIFEIGRCFHRQKVGGIPLGYRQPQRLAALIYGLAQPVQWGISSRTVDFYDLKADLEQLLSVKIEYQSSTYSALHPGRSANILYENQIVGYIGEIHPQIVQQLDLSLAPIVFEIELELVQKINLMQFREIPTVPAVIRDLALVVDENQSCGELSSFILQFAPKLIEQVNLFDLYTGNSVGSCKKSLAFRIVMRDTHNTLQDNEIDQLINDLTLALNEKFQASLRV